MTLFLIQHYKTRCYPTEKKIKLSVVETHVNKFIRARLESNSVSLEAT